MRHRTAARKGEDGGWHYVDMGRDGGHPIGFCREHEPHDTELEARQCYSRYLRQETIRLGHEQYARWTDCQVCGAPTKAGAAYGDDGYGAIPLCAQHMTVEHVIAEAVLDVLAGDAWYS